MHKNLSKFILISNELISVNILCNLFNSNQAWDKSFTYKVVNVVTKSVPNSGKSFLTNMELTQLVPIMEIQIFNSKESMFTIMKQLEEDTFQELFLWILNQEQWTQLELDHSVNSSDQITSSSVKLEPEITGLKVTILKELNLSIQYSMLQENKLKDVIAFKVSKLLTLSEEELDQVWELFSSLKSEKNIQTESCKPSLLSHHQKSQIQSLNHTMLLYLSINSSKMLTKSWLLTIKLFMISVSEPLNSPLQPMVT